jgi:fluoroquinolone transport system permease protein
MNEFLALVRHEIVLAWRLRLILVAIAFTIPPKVVVLTVLRAESVKFWLPGYMFSEVVPFAVLFIAVSLLLEKRQGTLLAFCVTPVATSVWIWAKVVSLSLVAFMAGLVLALFTPADINWPLLIVTLLVSAVLYNLVGLLVAMYFTSITSFFLPFALLFLVLGVSFYWHFGLIRSPVLWVLPTHPCMVLLNASFDERVPARTIITALALMTGWIILTSRWCKYAFRGQIAPRWGHADA